MGIIQSVEAVAASNTNRLALAEFNKLCRLIALHRGDLLGAHAYAKSNRVVERVCNILHKAATAGGSILNWGSELVEFKPLQDAFAASLRRTSVFDSILPSAVPWPIGTRAATVT